MVRIMLELIPTPRNLNHLCREQLSGKCGNADRIVSGNAIHRLFSETDPYITFIVNYDVL